MELKERNKALRKWLNDHSLINKAMLCRSVKYDRANFSRFMNKAHDLEESTILKFEWVLVDYGYKI